VSTPAAATRPELTARAAVTPRARYRSSPPARTLNVQSAAPTPTALNNGMNGGTMKANPNRGREQRGKRVATRRAASALAGMLAAIQLATAPAVADKPLIVEDVRFDPAITEIDPGLSQACGFPVTFSAKGRFRGTVYFNADGSFRRFVEHPSFRQTLSSQWGSITTDDRGVDKSALNPDGTLSIFGTGIHLRVKGEVHAIGLWRLVIDLDSGQLLDASYHGNFELEQPEIGPYICARLGPSQAR
jgi:hypothetical protein